MQELHDGLMREKNPDPFVNLLDTSIKWAEYTLRSNKDELLDCGLAISKALANYYHELNNPE